jgi:molybdopterin adenylyltransferase
VASGVTSRVVGGAVFLAVPKCLELLDNFNIQIDLGFVEQEF